MAAAAAVAIADKYAQSLVLRDSLSAQLADVAAQISRAAERLRAAEELREALTAKKRRLLNELSAKEPANGPKRPRDDQQSPLHPSPALPEPSADSVDTGIGVNDNPTVHHDNNQLHDTTNNTAPSISTSMGKTNGDASVEGSNNAHNISSSFDSNHQNGSIPAAKSPSPGRAASAAADIAESAAAATTEPSGAVAASAAEGRSFAFASSPKLTLVDGAPNTRRCRAWSQVLKSVYVNFGASLTPRAYALAHAATREFAALHGLRSASGGDLRVRASGHSVLAVPEDLFEAYFEYIKAAGVFSGYESGGSGNGQASGDDDDEVEDAEVHSTGAVSSTGAAWLNDTENGGRNSVSMESSSATDAEKAARGSRRTRSRPRDSLSSNRSAPVNYNDGDDENDEEANDDENDAYNIERNINNRKSSGGVSVSSSSAVVSATPRTGSRTVDYKPWADLVREEFPEFKTSRQEPGVRQRYNKVNQLAIRFHSIHNLNRSHFGGSFGIPLRLKNAWLQYVRESGVFDE
ncbi:hypothetical protein HDU83_000416 [Entophlyctis luteolus]|nr:hypothetical protein HDU83_000416 [Entophlyctis luteolus]